MCLIFNLINPIISYTAAAGQQIKYKAVSAGFRYSAALSIDGLVYVWGVNYDGQCNVPKDLKNVSAIDTGIGNVVALKEDGTVVVWGDNSYGQCNVPQDLTGVKAVSAGNDHIIALKQDGTIVAWGNNSMGQCNVPYNLKDVVAINSGYNHNLVLKSNGTVIAWGDNAEGQCDVPANLRNVKSIAAGGRHSSALDYDGNVISWGENYYLQCDTEDWNTRYLEEGQSPRKFKFINAGSEHTIALTYDNEVYCSGFVMNFSTDNIFTSIGISRKLENVVSMAVGEKHAIVLYADGSIEIYGATVMHSPGWYSYNGELVIPELIKDVKDVSFSGTGNNVSLNEDGTAVFWNRRNSKSPLISNIIDVASGKGMYFLKENGSVCYLPNAYTDTVLEAPPKLSNIKSITAIIRSDGAGSIFDDFVAIKNDGTLLAYKPSYHTSEWKEIDLPDDLSNVKAVEISDFGEIMILKNDGTVAIINWGKYNEDEVANSLKNVISIGTYHGKYAALKEDGTVVLWGDGSYHEFEKVADAVDIDLKDTFLYVKKKDGSVLKSFVNNAIISSEDEPFIYKTLYSKGVKFIQDGVAVMDTGSLEGYWYNFYIPPITLNQAKPIETPSNAQSSSTQPANTPNQIYTAAATNQNQPSSSVIVYSTPESTIKQIETLTTTPSATPTPTQTPKTTEEPSAKIPSAYKFKDTEGHWAEQSITNLASKGIVSGYSDGTLKPNALISRAELVKIIVNSLGYSPVTNSKVKFADSAKIPEWVKELVNTAVDKGIIYGFEDNTFRPNNNCTRQEVIVMLMRALSLGQSEKPLNYKDSNKIAKWAYKYLAKSVEDGIVTGYKDNTLRPQNYITRAEAITLIVKCLEHKNI